MSSNGLENGYGINGTTVNAGSQSNPYAINDFADLQTISSSNWGTGVYYQQTADITLTADMIIANGTAGSASSGFQGDYNGNGYKIDGNNVYGFSVCGYSQATSIFHNIHFDQIVVSPTYNKKKRSIIVVSQLIDCLISNLSISEETDGGPTGIGFVSKDWSGYLQNCICTNATIVSTPPSAGATVLSPFLTSWNDHSSYKSSTVTNCVVLSSSTSYPTAGHSFRVAYNPSSAVTLSNNYASSDCTPTSSSADASSQDGATITSTEYNSQSWWENTALYDFSSTGAWGWDSTTNLPKLKHASTIPKLHVNTTASGWKEGPAWVGKNGTWHQGEKIWVRINGAWQEKT